MPNAPHSERMRLFVHRTSSASLRVTIFLSLARLPPDLVEMVQVGLGRTTAASRSTPCPKAIR